MIAAPSHLEQVLREAISEGQPRTHRAWKKIIVVVEGIYSMEGELCRLKEIVAVAKKYKVVLFSPAVHPISLWWPWWRGVLSMSYIDTRNFFIHLGTGLHLSWWGTQHWSNWENRERNLWASGRRPSRHWCDDGHLHKILWILWWLHCCLWGPFSLTNCFAHHSLMAPAG